jgi:hypothetical protein
MPRAFTIRIELGNADMLTPADVSNCLEIAARHLSRAVNDSWDDEEISGGFNLRDINGNKVGRTRLVK